MPNEARQLGGFFALIVDSTTKDFPIEFGDTEIKCFGKNCNGIITSELLADHNEIHWKCSKCKNEGRISGWQETNWDNGKINFNN